MRLIRRLSWLSVVLLLAIGLAGCKEDPTGPVVSKQTGQTAEMAEPQDNQQVEENQSDSNKADKTEQKEDHETAKKQNGDESQAEHHKKNDEVTEEPKSDVEPPKEEQVDSDEGSNGQNQNEDTQADSAQKQPEAESSEQDSKEPATTSSENEESKPEEKEPKQQENVEAVTLTIISEGKKGTIVATTKVPIEEDDSLLDATLGVLKQRGIQYSVRGGGATAYVEGIANLYEFDRGPMSGWVAKKNGKPLSQSAGITSVADGDSIRWVYTTNYKVED